MQQQAWLNISGSVARITRGIQVGEHVKIGDHDVTIKAMIITLIVLGLIIVVAVFARPKVTSWRTYAAGSGGGHERSGQAINCDAARINNAIAIEPI
jgi:hypothetical protein